MIFFRRPVMPYINITRFILYYGTWFVARFSQMFWVYLWWVEQDERLLWSSVEDKGQRLSFIFIHRVLVTRNEVPTTRVSRGNHFACRVSCWNTWLAQSNRSFCFLPFFFFFFFFQSPNLHSFDVIGKYLMLLIILYSLIWDMRGVLLK